MYNKYFYKRPESECSIRNYMDGNKPLGSGNRLGLYEITAKGEYNPAPFIPINKSPYGNGGLTGTPFYMDQRQRKIVRDRNGNYVRNKDGKLKLTDLDYNQVKAIGKNHIFLSPLNERLKRDAIYNKYRYQMGRQYNPVTGKEIDDSWHFTSTNPNTAGMIYGWTQLPFSVYPTHKQEPKDAGKPLYEATLKLHPKSKNPAGMKYGQRFFPKLQVPPTDGWNDFYLLKLDKPDYISRIVIECGIKEAVTNMDEIEDIKDTFYESTINSIIKDQFEETIMYLYDENNTNKILETVGGVERIKPRLSPNSLESINNTNFKDIHIKNPIVDKEYQDKPATIDFYNVAFIPDVVYRFNNNFNKADKKTVKIKHNGTLEWIRTTDLRCHKPAL